MKFERTEIKVDVYGSEYVLRAPTVEDAEKLGEVKEDDVQGSFEKSVRLLEDLGLPENVTRSMEMNHLTQLMDLIMPKKKK